jgi:GH25 family lysozyme M1 (1,4-beta-N-acetylmuramidase)
MPAPSLWLASYNSGSEPARPLRPPFGRCKAWQFTGSGSIDGVDGRCDLSWALADDLRGYAHGERIASIEARQAAHR